MSLKMYKNSLTLILQMLDRRNSTKGCIPYKPQKRSCADGSVTLLPRSTPEEQGIESARVEAFLRELRDDSTLRTHSVTVIRNGSVIAGCGFYPYSADIWHSTFSLCKSITGLAIGLLISENKLSLDEKLTEIFERRMSSVARLRLRGLTVRHLLTMSSGIVFNEAGSVTEENWMKGFLESALRFEPGEEFAYNSMNTYMLSAIVREKTGEGLCDYLTPRLFRPLGIERYFWERCPLGIEKGGWGLYMLPEDMAKIGMLYICGGRYGGKQIIPERWIAEATNEQITVPAEIGRYGYGYHVWVGKNPKSVLMNGMFGQNVLCYPESGIIVAETAGDSDMFQSSAFFDLSDRYFGGGFSNVPLRADKRANKELADFIGECSESDSVSFSRRRSAVRECAALAGRNYMIGHGQSVGLLPLFVQTTQNNFSRGISRIGFENDDNGFAVTMREGDSYIRLPVGFEDAALTDITLCGEPYRVATLGRFTKNEDDIPVLKLRISFTELANERFLKIFFFGDRILAKWSERPGAEFLQNGFNALAGTGKSRRLLELVSSRVDSDYIIYKIKNALEPELEGILKK